MNDVKYTFTEEELELELGSWKIQSLSNGFAQSYKELYKTYRTTIAVKAFHIPNKTTGEIRHFDISLRVFKRNKKSESWQEQLEETNNPFGYRRQFDINVGGGKAVRELTNFLMAQYNFIGTKIESDKIIIEKPTDLDIEELVKKMSSGQIENFSQGIKLETLKNYKVFLENNLDKNEQFIQDWLDEENGKYRKQRCLIFGLEYIDHKREGELGRKRFDILTRSSMERNEYVILELKSPCDNIFKIEEKETKQGTSVEYHLSSQLSRAIPQILRYKSKFLSTSEDDDDLRRMGVAKGDVLKCIIILGQKKCDPIWNDHFLSLKNNLSNNLEIWTYTDLIDKLDITIRNLEDNLWESSE
jgi:hypothetical protein